MNIPSPVTVEDNHGWLDAEGSTRVADRSGPCGRAWLLQPEEAPSPQQEATLSTWLVNCPFRHPFWEWWTVTVVHLRDVEGLPSAERAYPEAEYEFQIRTLDPEESPTPDPDLVDEGWEYLDPPDVIEQFHGIGDHQAQALCSMAIQEILNGRVSPDVNFRGEWNRIIREKVAALRNVN
jgi:hypothetical protein